MIFFPLGSRGVDKVEKSSLILVLKYAMFDWQTVTDLLSFKAYFGPLDPNIKLYSKPNIGDVSQFLHIISPHS